MSSSNQASICNKKPTLHIITSKLNGWNFIEWLPSWFEMLEFFGKISPIFRLLEQTDTIFHTDNRSIDFSQIFFEISSKYLHLSVFLPFFGIFPKYFGGQPSQPFNYVTATAQSSCCQPAAPFQILPALFMLMHGFKPRPKGLGSSLVTTRLNSRLLIGIGSKFVKLHY